MHLESLILYVSVQKKKKNGKKKKITLFGFLPYIEFSDRLL